MFDHYDDADHFYTIEKIPNKYGIRIVKYYIYGEPINIAAAIGYRQFFLSYDDALIFYDKAKKRMKSELKLRRIHSDQEKKKRVLP